MSDSAGEKLITIGFDIAGQDHPNGFSRINWEGKAKGRVEFAEPISSGSTFHSIYKKIFAPLISDAYASDRKVKVSCGIDQPFGFPEIFIQAISSDKGVSTPEIRRFTEKVIRERTGIWPLSTVIERMTGNIVYRCKPLRHALIGQITDKEGKCLIEDLVGLSNGIFEVYPAAFLSSLLLEGGCKTCGISKREDSGAMKKVDYKGKPDSIAKDENGNDLKMNKGQLRLHILNTHLSAFVDINYNIEKVRAYVLSSDDALDAIICAIMARVCLIRDYTITPDERGCDLVKTEGWIHNIHADSSKCDWVELLKQQFPMPPFAFGELMDNFRDSGLAGNL